MIGSMARERGINREVWEKGRAWKDFPIQDDWIIGELGSTLRRGGPIGSYKGSEKKQNMMGAE